MDTLKQFDSKQLFRFFVDGRFHSKYNGWIGYEQKEKGSTQSMLNAFSYMLDNFELNNGLTATYILNLHKIAMFNVVTTNKKSSPGDLRYLNSGMPFFKKTTTLEHIKEVLDLRYNDSQIVFNTKKFAKPAKDLDANEIFNFLQTVDRITYRPWYPDITYEMELSLNQKNTLADFYEVKNYIQLKFAQKIDNIVLNFNNSILDMNTEDKIIYCISKIIRDLELLHPFPDGNCRTFANVLLNHLLLYYGLSPSILLNPNLDGEYSYAQFANEIKNGIKNTHHIIDNPDAKLFNYSIKDSSLDEQKQFSSMSKELVDKISSFDNLYLTLDIISEITKQPWTNYNKYIRFKGIGSHTTVNKNYIYYCFTKDWIKDKKNIKNEIYKASQNGATAFIIDDKEYLGIIDKPMLYVEDILETMEEISIYTRKNVGCKAVLITGTVGKTSFKFQLNHCLKNQTKVHAFLNSINTKIPVLRTLSSLSKDDKVEIVELSVGRSHLDVRNRSKMIAPDICIFTEIDQNHMNIHKNIETLVKAKASTVFGLKKDGLCIINSDASLYKEIIKEIKKIKKDVNILTFGKNTDDNARLISSTFDNINFNWNIEAIVDGVNLKYIIPLFHSHAPIQSLGVLLSIKRMGYNIIQAAKDYSKDFDSFSSIGRVFKLSIKDKHIIFYDQSYRGAIQGMRSAFKDIKNMDIKARKIFVIGASSTKEDNEFTQQQHKEIADMINNIGVDKLYTTGNYMDYMHQALKNKSCLMMHSQNFDEIEIALKNELKDGDFLFMMGSGDLYLGRLGDKILKFGTSKRIR